MNLREREKKREGSGEGDWKRDIVYLIGVCVGDGGEFGNGV